MFDLFTNVPTEVLTGLASGALGAWAKLKAIQADTQRLQVELAMAQLGARNDAANQAAARGGKWVRRILALMAWAYVFIWPAVFALLYAYGRYVPTEYLYNQSGGGFWIFGSKQALLHHATVYGFVITPLHTHLASAVGFFYFGASVVGRAK